MNSFPVEKFSKEEAWYISPFFTNLDKNVFAAKYLPSEVLGALASRYSRSTKGVRRLFFDEYIKPILEPNLEPASHRGANASRGGGAFKRELKEAETMKTELAAFVDFLHTHGGWESVVNSKRARNFFARWLAAYGDDSIAQMAGAHLFLEGVSQIATKTLEDFRIGFAPLEKSTRYVAFNTKIAGNWQCFIDPDLAKSSYGAEYKKMMNMLFRRYSDSIEPLSKYLRRKFKQEEGQTDRAYRETINAKSYDVLRAYLPAGTLTNVGFFGVGQAFEYVITKCLASPIYEMRELGKAVQTELMKVIPSMVERASSPRGKIYQKYVAKTEKALEQLVSKVSNVSKGEDVELVEWDVDAEDRIVASLLYKYATVSYRQIKEQVSKMSEKQKTSIIKKAVAARQVRQHRLVRAFENTYYKFDVIGNFGCYRDLHRHRMLTQERQRFTTELGFDVPPDLAAAKLEKPYIDAAGKIDRFYKKIKKRYPNQAQYVVMMGNKIRWYQWENLRELAWEAELRTGPQGHPDYRRIEHLKVEAVKKIHPTLVNVLKFVDFNKYDLARRESEMRIDRKLAAIK
ncbi:MAG: Thymidylate synthase complementing protein ThyX [Candidatus Curtissbacteria bacterium GW2011_GWA1_40_16]|uniref:Thymidylate synthase complementing protein ThyX n=1 Tax=Candidatus Curtissbacteria bacterium GW2011_GWA1_40_16 TaxID=1618405 RepID=A0A0G0TVW3_9BACT|nr:MAG: Thymidylate synthase complementing protein ThyX [Candidatus Curtissbacteria bacterium GW2011_GWA1_40_16]